MHDYRLLGRRSIGAAIEVVGEDRGDALVIERTDLEGAIGDPFGARRIDAAQQPHDPETGAEALLGVRPVGEDGDDQPLSARANRLPPMLEALRRPFGVPAMGTGHVLGVGAMAPAAIAPDMSGNALAAMEHLDRERGDADIDLLADQGVRHRIEETLDLDVIVQANARQTPLGIDIFGGRQSTQLRTLDCLE
jgi:hypothetical protein